MEKEKFIKAVNALIKQRDIDTKCNEAFKVILPNDYVSNYNNDVLYQAIIDLIDEKELVDYFIWELDCGRSEMAKDCITLSDGTKIGITTPEELWEVINKLK